MKAYQAGQAAAQRKDWPLVVRKMNDALATGHTQARTHFGTTRNFVDLYDPYYWLGVAHMELGEVLEAKRNLLLSRSEGVIDGFPESADLLGRLGQLERREAQQAAAPPTPTAGPTPEPTAAAAPSAVPTAAALSQGDATPTPNAAPGADPERILTLFSAGDFAGAEAAIESFRRARPLAREADLLATLVLGTRYVLEGSADPTPPRPREEGSLILAKAGRRPPLGGGSSFPVAPRDAERNLTLQRDRTTHVPAARSWKARFSFSKKAHTQPRPSGRPASTRTTARMRAAFQPMPRPPISPRLTTVSPRRDLPGVRPRHAQPPTT